MNAYVDPSSLSRPHLHCRPNVSVAVLCSSSLLPCSLIPGSAPSSRQALYVAVSPEQPSYCATFVVTSHRSNPMPPCRAFPCVWERIFLRIDEPSTTPRCAAVPCAMRHVVPRASVSRPSRRDVFVQVGAHAHHGRAHPSAQGQAFTCEPLSPLDHCFSLRRRVSVSSTVRSTVCFCKPVFMSCVSFL
jgi:hypothetical protein